MSRDEDPGYMGSFLKLSSSSTTVSHPSLVGPPPPPTRFKGVVLQHNGHWGAQIYANHTRIWLGTFKSEQAAAMAYDSAAMKLHRSSNSSESVPLHRNLPLTPESAIYEPCFQAQYTNQKLLEMIKDCSYVSKFQHFVKLATEGSVVTAASSSTTAINGGNNANNMRRERKLFEKEMTPSDVGKLNRLVVPKKYATSYFPQVKEDKEIEGEGGGGETVKVRDREGRRWSFRYCYWKSSQSFVFTKGWNKFVKEKGVRAKDVVGFYKSEEEEEEFVIDVVMRENGGGDENEVVVEEEEEEEEEVVESRNKRVKLFGFWVG